MFSRFIDTYFFTATINSWKKLLDDDSHKQIVIDSLKYFVLNKRILLHGFVIMPNHIHLLLTLREEETQEIFQRNMLRFTAREIARRLIFDGKQGVLNQYISTQKDRKYQIWERRSKWISILNEPILKQKLNYIHHNPVQEHWKLVEYFTDYPWSSANFYENGVDDFGIIVPA